MYGLGWHIEKVLVVHFKDYKLNIYYVFFRLFLLCIASSSFATDMQILEAQVEKSIEQIQKNGTLDKVNQNIAPQIGKIKPSLEVGQQNIEIMKSAMKFESNGTFLFNKMLQSPTWIKTKVKMYYDKTKNCKYMH